MAKNYPLKFTLEDGVEVEVNKAGNENYDFFLTSKEGSERRFTFTDDDRTKDQKVESLDFDELNAVRRFWLEKEESS